MALYESAWISFLRQYGPVSTNESMYDEHIQKAARNKKMHAVSFDAEYLDEIVENFTSINPVSVILTGTAGDGKTFYCRSIWKKLGGDSAIWEQKKKISTLFLPERHQQLVVIKDLSELNSEDTQQVLPQVAEAITRRDTGYVYLIAANDGQLMDKWREALDTPLIKTARRIVEDLLVNEQREKENVALRLYNLSRLPIKNLFPRVLNAVIQHEGWQTCEQCPFHKPTNGAKRCPIWENKQRLEYDEIARKRLLQLLELCEFNNIHLPVRQLLLLVSNMLLGHGHTQVKEHLMSCKDVPQLIDDDVTAPGNIYRNAFGENLERRRRQATDIFVALNRFGIGNETNSRIDNMLIFGKDDPTQRDDYHRFVLDDSYYGADNTYQSQQKAYLEGAIVADDGEPFLAMLRTQRQRLFFTLPFNVEDHMNLWGLTVFQYAGDYLKIVELLKQTDPITSKNTLAPLVRGLNRIFTGLLVNKTDKLILATSGSYSQARVCHILEEYVSVSKDKGQMVSLTRDASQRPLLQVSLGKDAEMKVTLQLQLTRFEFLRRVAEGALPSSFSRECYEDILSFKTSLLRQLDIRRRSDEEDTESELELNMIYLDNDGDIKDTSLEIQFS